METKRIGKLSLDVFQTIKIDEKQLGENKLTKT
jgi:hypothetical protein